MTRARIFSLEDGQAKKKGGRDEHDQIVILDIMSNHVQQVITRDLSQQLESDFALQTF